MCRDRVDVDAVLDQPLYVLVGLLLSYAVDDIVMLDRPRSQTRRILLYTIRNGVAPSKDQLESGDFDVDDEQRVVSRETWGMDDEAAAGQDAALALIGGAG